VHTLSSLGLGNEGPVLRREMPMATPEHPIAAGARADHATALGPAWRGGEETLQEPLRNPAQVDEERQVDVHQRVCDGKALPGQLDRAVTVDDPGIAPQKLRVRLQEFVMRDRGSARAELHHVYDVEGKARELGQLSRQGRLAAAGVAENRAPLTCGEMKHSDTRSYRGPRSRFSRTAGARPPGSGAT